MAERDDLLTDFLRWGFSDLRSNATRGVLAEYLIGRALNIDLSGVRVEWDAWDLRTNDGIKLEVKSAAYVQAWKPPDRPSATRYTGLLARSWTDESRMTGRLTETPDVRADVYVFALETCRDPLTYDALDISQWEFRVLPALVVRSWHQRSIGLNRLAALGYAGIPASALPQAVQQAADPTL